MVPPVKGSILGVRRADLGQPLSAPIIWAYDHIDRVGDGSASETNGGTAMESSAWFDIPVLGKLPPEQAARKLQELDETADAAALAVPVAKSAFSSSSWWPFTDRPWQHVGHAFGFVAGTANAGALDIADAGQIVPQEALRGARVKVTFDGLWAAGYPGRGEHKVLLDFYAQTQGSGAVEHLHFSTALRVRNGELVGSRGQPIFVGLPVGPEGLNFKCFTVNVANTDDEKFLAFLDSDAFRGGLKLISTLQPATALFSETTLALTRQVAGRHRNVPVQDFYLGLDFSRQPARAALAEGAYVAVQVPADPEKPWRWEDWLFLPGGQIVSRADRSSRPPCNYLLFTVTRFAGD
jgi:hypothetical protein